MRGSTNRHQPARCCSRIIATYQNPNTAEDLRPSASILFSKAEQIVCRSWLGCLERDRPLNFRQKASTAHDCIMRKAFQAQNICRTESRKGSCLTRCSPNVSANHSATYLQSEYQKHLYPHAASPNLSL